MLWNVSSNNAVIQEGSNLISYMISRYHDFSYIILTGYVSPDLPGCGEFLLLW